MRRFVGVLAQNQLVYLGSNHKIDRGDISYNLWPSFRAFDSTLHLLKKNHYMLQT